MPTVYLKMGLPNFLDIYIWYKVMGFIKTFYLKGVRSYTLTISTPPHLFVSLFLLVPLLCQILIHFVCVIYM